MTGLHTKADPGGHQTLAVAGIVLATATFTMVVVVIGAVASAKLGDAENAEVWSRRGDAGDSFGLANTALSGFAFAALVVTLWIQFRELRMQREELRLQRGAIERSQLELRRSAEAGMRMLHFELIKLSIADEDLAAVWPDVTGVPHHRSRKFLYANLIFQHISLSMRLSEFDDDSIRQTIRLLFESDFVREYWHWASRSRKITGAPGSESWRIAQIGNSIYREYHPGAVLDDDEDVASGAC